ncbi:MAG: hypothetical protein WA738_02020 [Candidatus Angelobacter sp.]
MAIDMTINGNDLSTRVRRTLQDMTAIRQSLLDISEESSDLPADPSKCLDLELAGELKSVVDALRLLLWAYIKALSAKSGRAPAEVLNWYKMELAVEMLRSVGPRAVAAQGCIAEFENLVNHTLAASAPAPKARIQ